ncbi:unnamed protein product [Prorocentrum cordatum]|uniref:Uncharacterized protein n=1 Tax=Prorocentrum cordatum TaxID=2364126 RepID=A0ABN9QPW9_9DINO|nr:unnamed protein product [Polarella glacialis]
MDVLDRHWTPPYLSWRAERAKGGAGGAASKDTRGPPQGDAHAECSSSRNGRGEVQATVAIIAWLPIGSAWLALARATNGSKTYRDKQKKRRLGPPRARPRPGGRATPARAARQPSHGHAALRGARGAPRRQALVGGVPGKARKKLLGRPQAS